MSWILSRYAPNVPYTVSVLAMGIIFSATLNHFNLAVLDGPAVELQHELLAALHEHVGED